jgi:hypothetical protein
MPIAFSNTDRAPRNFSPCSFCPRIHANLVEALPGFSLEPDSSDESTTAWKTAGAQVCDVRTMRGTGTTTAYIAERDVHGDASGTGTGHVSGGPLV